MSLKQHVIMTKAKTSMEQSLVHPMRQPMLVLNNLGFRIKEMDRPILENVNFKIYPGEFVIVLGGNGSGKTSLMKLINRSYQPTSGNIEFKHLALNDWKNKELARALVSLAQDSSESLFYELTVLENCLLWETRHRSNYYKISRQSDKQLFEHYLQSYHPRLGERLQSPVRLLSGGEKQALLLALCVKTPPRLLLLDEHTSALDPSQSKNIMKLTLQMVREQSITTLMTTHNLEQALEFGDRIIALKEGRIIFEADKVKKASLTRQKLLEFCY